MLNVTKPHSLPLFRRWPALAESVPWLSIGNWPTPVTEVRAFSAAHGLRSFWFKREDLSHPISGGNKPRGLEFLLAHAQSRNATKLLTLGAAGSHHICRTAFHAAPLNMKVIAVVVPQPSAEYVRRNLLLGASLGVEFIPANFITAGPAMVAAMLNPRHWHDARPPHYLQPGGTSARSILGHVNAALELKLQVDAGLMPEPDYLYVSMGSLGTAAGLLLGCRLAGLKTRIVGVAVSYRWYCTPGRCAAFARAALRFMRRHDPDVPEVGIGREDIDVIKTALADGYARFTIESIQLARQLRNFELIPLDGTYTAKTLHGALDFIRHRGSEDKSHLFWNSYHVPSVAPGAAALIAALPPTLQSYFSEPVQSLDELLDYPDGHGPAH